MKASAAILAAFISTAVAAGDDRPPMWTLVVRPFGTTDRDAAEAFWVGLRNASTQDRAFCVLGVRYAFTLPDGTIVEQPTVEYPDVRSPHSCADSMGILVLPGETHFVQVKPRRPSNAARSSLRFGVIAEEACLTPGCREHSTIMIYEGP
jgi:hypothetical protein